MVLPRSTFHQAAHQSSVSLPLQQQQQQQKKAAPLASSSSINNGVETTKRRVTPPCASEHPERRQSPSSLVSNHNNNNNKTIAPNSALELLKRNRQQDASRLSLLLPNTTAASTSHESTTIPSTNLLSPFSLTTGITQIYGEAGSGKTQLGLSACVSCVACSNENMALHVSLGEGTSPTKIAQRLHQMATSRNRNTNTNVNSLLQRIQTRSLRNEDDVVVFVKKELPHLLASHESTIQVIVLDSIGGMFRISENQQTSYIQRSSMLFDIASHLKQLSSEYQIPVIVVNQVSTRITTNTLIPALGVSWAACVNTSYHVQRTERQVQSNEKNESTMVFQRTITLVQSSSWPNTTVPFDIQASGVVAISRQE